jgi:hypothetical protein
MLALRAPRRCAVALMREGLIAALGLCCADRVGTPGVRQRSTFALRAASNTAREAHADQPIEDGDFKRDFERPAHGIGAISEADHED